MEITSVFRWEEENKDQYYYANKSWELMTNLVQATWEFRTKYKLEFNSDIKQFKLEQKQK